MEKKEPIEVELFIMKLDSLNEMYREYPSSIAQEWIDNLNNGKVKSYEIEYAINCDAKDLKTEYCKKSLSCGIVTSLRIDEEKRLFAKAKFKTNSDFAEALYAEDFKELTLVPKGTGKIEANIISDYNLYCFNLIKCENSSFIKKEK